jgi:hypothetical protein
MDGIKDSLNKKQNMPPSLLVSETTMIVGIKEGFQSINESNSMIIPSVACLSKNSIVGSSSFVLERKVILDVIVEILLNSIGIGFELVVSA